MEEKIIYHKTEEDIYAAKVDANAVERIYHPSITKMLLTGFFAGGIIFGFIAYLVASGIYPITGFGYFSASGIWPAIVVGFGFGSSIGALILGWIQIKKVKRLYKKGNSDEE